MTELFHTEGAWRHAACGTLVSWDAEKQHEYCPRCLDPDPVTTYDPEQPVDRELGFCAQCFRVRYLAFAGRPLCTQCRREHQVFHDPDPVEGYSPGDPKGQMLRDAGWENV